MPRPSAAAVASLLAGLLLAWMLFSVLNWESASKPHQKLESTYPESASEQAEQGGDGGTVSRATVEPDSPSNTSLVRWDSDPSLPVKFQQTFHRIRFAEGGEEMAINFSLEVFEARKGTRAGQRLTALIEAISDSDFYAKGPDSQMFTDILFGADAILGNYLSDQIVNYRKFMAKPPDNIDRFPLSLMRFDPLLFSPEVYVAYFLPDQPFEALPAAIWSQLGESRNAALQEYALLYQEFYLMTGSVERTIRSLTLDIPYGDRNRALRLLLPEYMDIEDQLAELSKSYPYNLLRILAANGYPTRTNLW